MQSPHSDLTVQTPPLHPDPGALKSEGEPEWFHPSTLYLWLLTILVSALAISAMNYKWLNVHRLHKADTTVVRNQSELKEFLRKIMTRENLQPRINPIRHQPVFTSNHWHLLSPVM